MPRRRTWPSALFLYENQQLKRIDYLQNVSFHVGIWWHDTDRLVAYLQSIAEIETADHLIDSELDHAAAWETARRELSCRTETEYSDVPHGRITWDTIHQCGILYHGNSTSPELIEELARLYRLPRWEVRLDVHYLTGEALSEFYSLDERQTHF